ncbi:MAG TPA: aldose epimerase family protein [Eubacteriales bacterium]|nr:aldose epimerase family protein [Eubacteriales bacterium]
MSITKSLFGKLPDGEEVFCYTAVNQSGASASFLTYGAVWRSMCVPNQDGVLTDVVLGFDTLEAYLKQAEYIGATIGRVANRIGNARFTLNGKEYALFANDFENCSHGGKTGFDKRNWKASVDGDSVVFTLFSPDGDENFPGTLTVMVVYTLTEKNALSIRYFAVTDADTLVSLTNHAYFNLAGQGAGTILKQTLQIDAERFTCIDPHILPTGKIAPVAGGPLDFLSEKPIGCDIESNLENMPAARGYDHNFVLRHPEGGIELVASAADPDGGIEMDVYTDQPGVQLYTPYDLNALEGKDGVRYGFRPAFCLETQHFADAPAHPDFPSIVLHAGEVLASETVYAFSAKTGA